MKNKSNPFELGTWSYDFWQDGFDNPYAPNPYLEPFEGYTNEFAAEQYQDGQNTRKGLLLGEHKD